MKNSDFYGYRAGFILYLVNTPTLARQRRACVVIPAKAGIQILDASVRWHDNTSLLAARFFI